jgi:methionyl-tRNA formyltransferase
MTALPRSSNPQRILFFGMRCAFSAPPLEALVNASHEIAAVVLPGPPFGPPIMTQPIAPAVHLSMTDQPISKIDTLAHRVSAPILTIGNLNHGDAVGSLRKLEPDLIAVACYPSLLPAEILNIPRLGSVNVHPSLLPRGRGPEPLFWTFRRGEPETGVTIHLLDDRFDTGPILLQERVTIPIGIRLSELELQLSELGGALLLQAIEQLVDGSATHMPQADAEATTAPIPGEADYEVRTDLPAQWAFNFVRAIGPTIGRLKVVVRSTNEEIAVTDAVSYSDNDSRSAPVQFQENRVVIGFRPGSVTFVLPHLG